MSKSCFQWFSQILFFFFWVISEARLPEMALIYAKVFVSCGKMASPRKICLAKFNLTLSSEINKLTKEPKKEKKRKSFRQLVAIGWIWHMVWTSVFINLPWFVPAYTTF